LLQSWLYLGNIKWLCMSICCDINTMGVVEHKRSLRGTWGTGKCFSDFWSALQLPECLYDSIIIDKSSCFILLFKIFEAIKCASVHWKSVLWYRHSCCKCLTNQSAHYILDILYWLETIDFAQQASHQGATRTSIEWQKQRVYSPGTTT
jgi:hypothetical protein